MWKVQTWGSLCRMGSVSVAPSWILTVPLNPGGLPPLPPDVPPLPPASALELYEIETSAMKAATTRYVDSTLRVRCRIRSSLRGAGCVKGGTARCVPESTPKQTRSVVRRKAGRVCYGGRWIRFNGLGAWTGRLDAGARLDADPLFPRGRSPEPSLLTM